MSSLEQMQTSKVNAQRKGREESFPFLFSTKGICSCCFLNFDLLSLHIYPFLVNVILVSNTPIIITDTSRVPSSVS